MLQGVDPVPFDDEDSVGRADSLADFDSPNSYWRAVELLQGVVGHFHLEHRQGIGDLPCRLVPSITEFVSFDG
jgi:hypothetical protein